MKKALINSVLLYCSIASLAILTAMFTPSISSTANFTVGSPHASTSLGLNHSSTEGVESAINPNRETSSINAVAAMAATLIVDTTSDEGDGSCADGDCSLRDALASAIGGDMIQFTVTGTITLTLGELVIDRNLMIEGPGADRLTISGNNSSRVFKISSGVTAMISGLTISNGAAPIGGGILNDHGTLTITNSTIAGNSASTFQNAFGGGIYNAQGTITITTSTVSGNSASDIFGFGGGIYNTAGTLTINNSTVSGNSASSDVGGAARGGGIYNEAAIGIVMITNSTVSGNSASSDVGSDCTGGGIYSFGGRLTLSNSTVTGNSVSGIPDGNDNLAGGGIYNRNGLTLNISNSIVANNTAPASPDIFGPLNSGDFNLIKDTSGIVGPLPGSHNITGQDPRLAPLGDYGGPTKTHALLPDSPALDVLPNQTDQRGVIRPKGNGTDIGSFEISISISPSSLADAKQGALYSQLLSATDCSGLCAFDLIDGSLPSGLSLSSDGVISGVPAETGAFSFTVSAKDSTGVAGVRQYAFNVLSADEPSIVCPANITISNDSGECSASVSFTVNSAGGPAPTVECRVNGAIITSPYTFSIGTTEVNCMATNAGGRAACSFNVTVNDTQSPSIICQSNQVVVESPSGSGQAVVNYPEPEASDNCAVASLVCSPASGSVFPLGTTTVTCTGTDTSGNTANCSFSVTVTASLDICLEDDSVAANELRFNSITGDYLFCCGSMTVAGRGKINKKGCTITLTDNSTGRRVNATVDTCQSRGSATLQSPPGSILCTITDRDIRNNSCSCSGS